MVNRFLDHHGVLDAEYERAVAQGRDHLLELAHRERTMSSQRQDYLLQLITQAAAALRRRREPLPEAASYLGFIFARADTPVLPNVSTGSCAASASTRATTSRRGSCGCGTRPGPSSSPGAWTAARS